MTKLLIIKPSSLGDIVHGLQLAAAIREQIDCRITWVAREVFAPLVEASTVIDRTLVFERRGGLGGFRRLLGKVREDDYEAVLDLQGLARTGLLTVFARSRKKFGRSDAREWAGFAYTKTAALPPNGRASHAVDILMEFIPLLGLEKRESGPLAFRRISMREDWKDFVAKHGAPILLFPGSRRAEKVWPGFAALTERFLEKCPETPVVWLGSERVATSLAGERFLNLAGQTTLPELIPWIEASSWTVANDSGPMHLAAAMRKRTVGLFGPTDPSRYGPYPPAAPTNFVIRAPEGNLDRLEPGPVFELLMSESGGGEEDV